MIRVGLTGGIGSGKTTVARVWETLGVPVYYADERGRWLSDNDREVILKIQTVFGPESYLAEGTLNRKYISSKVFSHPGLLKRLNHIIHPAVRKDYRAWSDRHADSPYTVMETAILLESGFDSEVDKIVVVTAPEGLRIARTMRRDGLNEAAVRARMNAQIAEKQRTEKADFLLHADEQELLIPRILELHEKLSRLSDNDKPQNPLSRLLERLLHRHQS